MKSLSLQRAIEICHAFFHCAGLLSQFTYTVKHLEFDLLGKKLRSNFHSHIGSKFNSIVSSKIFTKFFWIGHLER